MAPAAEPVEVAEALRQLRIDDDANGPLLLAYLKDARERAEHELGRSLITQSRVLRLQGWPDSGQYCGAIRLDRPPVQAVGEIRYWSSTGWAVLDPTAYTLERLDTLHHLVMPVTGWPELGQRRGVRVEVSFTAGFGNTGSTVPESIRQWIVATAGHNLESPNGADAPNEYLDRRLDAWRTRM